MPLQLNRLTMALDGKHDVWLASCSGFYESPFGQPGQPCPQPFWGCFECQNAVITARKLPAILLFLEFITAQRATLSESHWVAKFGRVWSRITTQILPAFPSAVVEDAALEEDHSQKWSLFTTRNGSHMSNHSLISKVDATHPVLATAPLKPGFERSELSKFGDDSWDLSPAVFRNNARRCHITVHFLLSPTFSKPGYCVSFSTLGSTSMSLVTPSGFPLAAFAKALIEPKDFLILYGLVAALVISPWWIRRCWMHTASICNRPEAGNLIKWHATGNGDGSPPLSASSFLRRSLYFALERPFLKVCGWRSAVERKQHTSHSRANIGPLVSLVD